MLRRLALPGIVLVLALGGLALWLYRDRGTRDSPWQDPVELESRVRKLLHLEPERGSARIAGTVLWPDGTPVERARVDAEQANEYYKLHVTSAESDAGGRFVLEGLPDRGVLAISASHVPPGVEEPAVTKVTKDSWTVVEIPGVRRWRVVAESVPAGTEDLVLTLLEPLSVSGTVVDDTGAPVRSFTLSGRPTHSPERRWYGAGESFEAADGAFTLSVAPAGEWRFTAQSSRRESEPETIVVPGASLRLVLPRPSTVAGRVLLPTGGPATDAEVQPDPGPAASTREESVRTGPDGSFRLEPYAQSLTLRATHPDWAASEPVRLSLAPGETQTVLALREGARITGKVVDDRGRPEPGWEVGCASGERRTHALMTGAGVERSTVSDESGGFVLEHVTPGRIEVSARLTDPGETGGDLRAARLVAPRWSSVTVADGGQRDVVLRPPFPRPVRVHGHVRAAGKPVAERSVCVQLANGGLSSTTTDRDGRYQIEVESPGNYVFGVGAESPGDQRVTPFYAEVPEVEEHELDLALPSGRIGGVVLGPDDAPAARVRLRLVPAAGALGADEVFDATAAADGSFAFEHLRAGTYTLHVLRAMSELHEPHHGELVVDGLEVVEDRALDGLTVRLGRPGTLAGIVRDSSGMPVAEIPVFVRDSAGHVLSPSECTTYSDGRFEYHGITPGQVTAIARSARLPLGARIEPGACLAGIESSAVTVRAGATTTVELFVLEGACLRVSLLNGEHAVPARLRVLDALGRRVDELAYAYDFTRPVPGRSSPCEHRVGPLAPGSYTLVATTLDGNEVRDSVVVELGKDEQKVELRLD